MEKQLYIIEYENAHYCGGGLHCLVWATTADEAEEIAGDWMQDCQWELFSNEYEDDEDEGNFDECMYSVMSVNLLETSDMKQYVDMPDQESFYPVVNSKE
jgi:hypothetical protein